jgi:putative nucleotidyltransferase with HDIG domain
MRLPALLRRARVRVRYRGGQFFRGLRTRFSAQEMAAVRALLSPAELRIFLAMEPRDRRHSYDVLRWLEVTAGSQPPSDALRKAALLHDVGKGQLWVWDRVAFVLLEAASPRFGSGFGAPHGSRWRQALWRLRHHARLGADMLTEAGVDTRVIELVAGHTGAGAGTDRELARLIEADRAS